MIVCSCNVLSAKDIRGCLRPGPDCPRTPAQVYRCLGCRAECGHCARTIRSLMDEALAAAGATCPPACAQSCCQATAIAEALAAATRDELELSES